MGQQPTDGCPTCQVCGGLIHSTVYYWNDDQRLPMHADMRHCKSTDPQLFANFMNRNVDYINQRAEPVLLGDANVATTRRCDAPSGEGILCNGEVGHSGSHHSRTTWMNLEAGTE